MTGIANADGGSLLGATRIRVDLTLAGSMTMGLGVINIQAATDAIWNAQGQAATQASTGYFRLRDPRNLLNRYDWSFDKFLDSGSTLSWRVVNGIGTLALAHSAERSALFSDPTSVYVDQSITVPNDSDTTQHMTVEADKAYKLSAWGLHQEPQCGHRRRHRRSPATGDGPNRGRPPFRRSHHDRTSDGLLAADRGHGENTI